MVRSRCRAAPRRVSNREGVMGKAKRNEKVAIPEADSQDEVIGLEECAKAGKTPPRGKKYRVRSDKHHCVVTVTGMTGRQRLPLSDEAPPERYILSHKMRGGQVKLIGLDEETDFLGSGVERFMTLARDQTEG